MVLRSLTLPSPPEAGPKYLTSPRSSPQTYCPKTDFTTFPLKPQVNGNHSTPRHPSQNIGCHPWINPVSYYITRHIKKLRHYFANKGLSSQSYGFSSSHVWIWELDYKESWATRNWCSGTVVLEKTLESPLDCKEIQPVRPKGDQSWIFIGRTYAESNILATWCEELTHLKRPWCWERLKVGGEGDDRGWDGWMASLT